jgi:hypothetical protein
MAKVLNRAITGLLILIAANSAIAQTNPAGPRVKLQVVLNHFEGETKTGSVPFFFSLTLNQKGTLRVDADPAKAQPSEPCSSLIAAQPAGTRGGDALESVQFVGTQVESTVTPAEDGAFSVNLQFTERARAGCTDVGGLWIPIFSNRIISHVIRIRNGEPGEIVLEGDAARNESTKVTVTLTAGN